MKTSKIDLLKGICLSALNDYWIQHNSEIKKAFTYRGFAFEGLGSIDNELFLFSLANVVNTLNKCKNTILPSESKLIIDHIINKYIESKKIKMSEMIEVIENRINKYEKLFLENSSERIKNVVSCLLSAAYIQNDNLVYDDDNTIKYDRDSIDVFEKTYENIKDYLKTKMDSIIEMCSVFKNAIQILGEFTRDALPKVVFIDRSDIFVPYERDPNEFINQAWKSFIRSRISNSDFLKISLPQFLALFAGQDIPFDISTYRYNDFIVAIIKMVDLEDVYSVQFASIAIKIKRGLWGIKQVSRSYVVFQKYLDNSNRAIAYTNQNEFVNIAKMDEISYDKCKYVMNNIIESK